MTACTVGFGLNRATMDGTGGTAGPFGICSGAVEIFSGGPSGLIMFASAGAERAPDTSLPPGCAAGNFTRLSRSNGKATAIRVRITQPRGTADRRHRLPLPILSIFSSVFWSVNQCSTYTDQLVYVKFADNVEFADCVLPTDLTHQLHFKTLPFLGLDKNFPFRWNSPHGRVRDFGIQSARKP